MRTPPKIQAGALVVLSSMLLFAYHASATRVVNGATSAETRADSPLEQCLGRQRKLSALFLVDESASLVKTDPLDERVPALKAAARALNSITRGSGEDAVKVDISLAGFGGSYTERREWGPLNDSTLDGFLAEVDKQAEKERKNSIYTRYHIALRGAIDSFVEHENDGSNCRLLIWFSDGKHDDDNDSKRYSGGFSPKEKSQISQVICGSNGYANELREQKVFVQAIGLNSQESDMALMRLVAEGQGAFNQGGVSLSNCGTLPALGSFGYAEDSSQIVDEFTNVPGSPRDDIRSSKCADGASDCSEIRFVADEALVSFKAQITRPVDGVTSGELKTGSGATFELFGDKAEQKTSSIAVERLTENKVLIDAHRVSAGDLAGEWVISFSGPAAKEVVGRVKFLGDASIKLQSDKGDAITQVDRFDTKDVFIGVDGTAGSTIIERLEVSLRNSKQLEKLSTVAVSTGKYRVNHLALSQILQSTPFNEASAVEMSVQPVGFVKGLEGLNGPVGVEFKPSRAELGVTNGKSLPQYLPPGPNDTPTVFDGTNKAEVTARFLGPDAGDGTVTWVDADANDNNFSVEDPGKVCKVPRQTEVSCTVAIKPGKSGYGPIEVPIKVKLASVKGGEERTQTIPLKGSMTRDANVGKGIRNAVLLFVLFFTVQLLIRAFFAAVISRFPAMSPVSRRARIDVSIRSDGSVSGTANGRFVVNEGDEGFTFENMESCGEFDLFGYRFACTPLRTFLRSTTSPRGQVRRGGSYVFGSAGTKFGRAKNGNTSPSTGLIELSLRNQWVLAVEESAISQMLAGTSPVPGEIVAYLDPLETTDLETQLADLEFRITSSQFATDLASVIERARPVEAEGTSEQEIAVIATSTPDLDDPFRDFNEPSPFDDSNNSNPFTSLDIPIASSGKGRRGLFGRRRSPKGEATNQTESPSFTEIDPFGEPDLFG